MARAAARLRAQVALRRLAAVCLVVATSPACCPTIGWGAVSVEETGPHPGWLTYESPHYTFYYAPDSALNRGQQIKVFAQQHEAAFARISKYLDVTPKNKIVFYVYDNNDVANKLIGQNAGFTMHPHDKTNGPAAVIHARLQQSLGHETTHAVAFWLGPPHNRVLSEGLAVFLDQSGQDRFQVGQRMLQQGKLPDYQQMQTASKEKAESWYPAAGSFVAFLCQQYGIDKFKALWKSRKAFEDSVVEIYGKPLGDIEKEWRQFLRRYVPPQQRQFRDWDDLML